MVIENELPSLVVWLPVAAMFWVVVVACLGLLGTLVAWLFLALESGPTVAIRKTARAILGSLSDLLKISPRRVWALSWLAAKEAIRRRIVVVFAVFMLVLLLAAWFLDRDSPNPAGLYLNFVLTATTFLILLLALFLSTFSLPSDIRSKTLHTVVTKPVRKSEIVLGRMIGFAGICTGLLLLMGSVSYLFVVRGLSHSHELTAEDMQPVSPAIPGQPRFHFGKSSRVSEHRHQINMMTQADGSEIEARLEPERGHTHELTISGTGADATYQIGPPRDMLQARVPVYGKLTFRDRDGIDAAKGINVGDEWAYRGFIAGGTPAAMMWTFDDLTPARFPDELPLEFTLGVFRTHKGNMEQGIWGSVALRNPATGLTVEIDNFESKEFATNTIAIPRQIDKFSSAQFVLRKVETAEGILVRPEQFNADPSLAEQREFDLYEDLVADGQTEVWIRCSEPGQYFGGAQADLYLRASDASFLLNFAKAYVGIWLQMLLVIGLGVTSSTFLSGSVAMIATLGALVGGFFSKFIAQLSQGEVHGGGPVEALIRILRQENLMTELESAWWIIVMEMFDKVAESGLWVLSVLLPAFGQFNCNDYVAKGFNIPIETLLIHAFTALAYLFPIFVAGYIFLKSREVAR